jgi:hypothetical protein
MAWSKRDFVTQAFEQIGLAAYVFDLQPDQLESARRKLDSMMALWFSKGIDLGYTSPVEPNGSDLDDDSGVSNEASEAIYSNLALRIAPSFGKAVTPELKLLAKQSYDALLIAAAAPGQMQMPGGFPLGAGYKSSFRGFTSDPE